MVSDSLRTRIAAALKKQAEFRGIYKIADFDYPFLADAVIRELGLRQESTHRVIYPDLPAEIIKGKRYTRYVTDWNADDE